MILFFDTETTGMVDFRMPPDHESQPHLVQLGLLLTENDGTERACVSVIVNPGVPIPVAASDIHGITDEIAKLCGIKPVGSVGIFFGLRAKVDVLVAHNVDFDLAVMQSAAIRVDQRALADSLNIVKTVCTMKAATPVCKIPHANPRGPEDYKWPKLEECVRHFFGEELEGAHDAMVDVQACKRVFFKLKEIGAVA